MIKKEESELNLTSSFFLKAYLNQPKTPETVFKIPCIILIINIHIFSYSVINYLKKLKKLEVTSNQYLTISTHMNNSSFLFLFKTYSNINISI